ncbi:cyclin-like protein [Halteromyces radiatus]|uniref:cyclin-like protein n=1 Tax=Halteromyces radiatus TaxID=101107 RepID=UPI00221E7589|nr:cyclin-like protein [Halteromyces radiatus]KAI8089340.1 cyclin-like protein [Halteromyces radiatus]
MSGSSPNINSTNTPFVFGTYYKRRYRPYFTKRQLATIDQLNGQSMKNTQTLASHGSSCKFIQQVGKRLGFPQTTISTSQALYHRFYLYHSIRNFQPLDLCITCLFVGSKIEETIKRLKDIYIVAHSVRHPKSQELEPDEIPEDRIRRINEYEKLLLETLCFNFQIKHPYEYIVKFARHIQELQGLDGKQLAKKAYSLAVDSYRMTLCLEYPAHTIAAGCIYLASKLWQQEDSKFGGLDKNESWEKRFLSRLEDVKDVGRKILDYYISKPNEFGPSIQYMQIKIQLNEETNNNISSDKMMMTNNQSAINVNNRHMDDPLMNEQTRMDDKWEPNQLPSYDVDLLLNTNTHTVSYFLNPLQ